MKKISFNKNLLIVFLVFFVLTFINYFLLQRLEDQRATDGVLIDIAGRNRMLSQQLGFYAEQIVRGREELKTTLESSIALHQESLAVLKNGGIPPRSLFESQLAGCPPGVACPLAPALIERTLPEADADVVPFIQEVETLWVEYKKNAEIIARELTRVAGEENSEVLVALEYIESYAPELLKRNDALVKAYVEMSADKQAKMSLALLLSFVVTMMVIALGTWFITLINKKSEEMRLETEDLLKNVKAEKEKGVTLVNDLKKFKMAVDNASDHIVITDSDGIVLYGNKAMEKTTGYSVAEALGKKAGTLWKTPMPHEYYVNLWRVIKQEKKTFVGEVQNKRKGGEPYTAQISISPVLNERGEVIYFVGIERDISKEKEIDKAKTEFVSLASHQLRTPLSAISWYTEMLLAGDAGKITAKQQKYLTEIYVGNQRMVDLVNALLNVSRLDLGAFVLEVTPTNVTTLTKSVLGELNSLVVKKNIVVREEYTDIPGDFSADEKLLRSVVQNIVSNAVKYTPDNGTVTLRWCVVRKHETFGGKKMFKDTLAFSAEDSGIGVPKEQQDKIFEKLFRADNAAMSEAEGTGLGLYIVKSIIDKTGGRIWFISEEGKGSTFYVAFPLSGMKRVNGFKKTS